MENYDRLMENHIASFSGNKPSLLLQVCCAPCLTAVLERLYPHFEVTLFYFNPNTHPEEEYEKRYLEIPKFLRSAGMENVPVVRGDYDAGAFFTAAQGLEAEPEGGARCTECFRLRLGETARLAKEMGFSHFCTTLTVSPHKNAALINSIGEELSRTYGVTWLPSDFKKRDGYRRSVTMSAEHGLYRQCYCGCVYSDNRR